MTEAPAQPTLEQRANTEALRQYLAQWRGVMVTLVLITLGLMLAWRSVAQPAAQWAWGVMAMASCLCQAIASWQLERAPSLTEVWARWMPLLLGGIVLGGAAWGLVPWMLAGISVPTLVLACLFGAMLVFCVMNTPGTFAMHLCAIVPFALVSCTVLFLHNELFLVGVGYVLLLVVIQLYGQRVRRAAVASLREHLHALDLAEALRRQQQQLNAVERERAMLLERQRLMRDIHDGLGGALTSSLMAVEQGEVRPAALAAMLRDCVDDLRGVIDSLEPVQHDLVAVLATLRTRLERRLRLAGVQLEWDMQDLPPLAWMGPAEALQIMRLVQEVLHNVIKHAAAQRVRIAARLVDGAVELQVADDGRGFDASVPTSGRGMVSVRQRAQALGAQIAIVSRVGHGTDVRLRLPPLAPIVAAPGASRP